MSHSVFASGDQRRRAAQAAFDARRVETRPRLRVRCSANHRVAEVWETDLGLVYRAPVGRRAHGHRDDVDPGHGPGARRRSIFVDLLEDEASDDGLPASCECGPRQVSRRDLADAIGRHERQVLVP